MKQEAIGTITRHGGFSRVVSEVHNTGEPIQILRNNEAVAIVVPANRETAEMFNNAVMFGRTIGQFVEKGLNRELELYLVSQMLSGLQAKVLLGLALNDEQLVTLEKSIIDGCRVALEAAVQKVHREDSAML
jgi:antitoxin (DNA-binding transcriptional repressor) of toxin-antitoxin stability system